MINIIVQNKKVYDKKEVLFLPFHIEFKKILERFNEKDSSFIEEYIRETKFKQIDSAILKLPEMNNFVLLKGIKNLKEDITKAIKKYCSRIDTLVFDIETFKPLNIDKTSLIHLIVKNSIIATYKGIEETPFLEEEKLKKVIINVSEVELEETKKVLHEALLLYSSSLEGMKFSNKIFLNENKLEKIFEQLKKFSSKKTKIKVYKTKEFKAQKLNSILSLQEYFLEEPIIYIAENNPERGKNVIVTSVFHLDYDEKNNFKEYHSLSLIKGLQDEIKEDHNVTLILLLLKTKNSKRILGKKIRNSIGIEYFVNTKEDVKKVLLSDLMFLASKQKPRQIITVNFSNFKPLGESYIPFYSNSDFLSRKLSDSGEKVFENVWRLPLQKFEGKIFEFKNDENYNVAILEHNAQGYPWMYIDFPKVFEEKNLRDKIYSKGNTGIGIALLKDYINTIHKKR